MKKVSGSKVVTTSEASELPLPAEIQAALGELVGAAREGLLSLSVGVGLTVVHRLMELEVDEVVGPKGKWNPDREAKRHGHEDGSVTLGGRRCRSAVRGCGPLRTSTSCQCRHMRTSPIVTR
jgi:hypothetical protein